MKLSQLSDFGKKYLLLGLRINKLVDGYKEAYFGPEELELKVNVESAQNPQKLINQCIILQKSLKDQGFEEERKKFIMAMLKAMETRLRIENKEQIPFMEKVKRLYDIEPQYTDDSYLFTIVDKLDQFYEGSGPLKDRIQAERKKQEISSEKVIPLCKKALNILHSATLDLFSDILPKREKVSIEIVKDKSWNAYNWYLGSYQSRIDINTKLPTRWTTIFFMSAHEGYPGHHTEYTIKESLLFRGQNRFEHCIVLVHTPEAVVSEGIANMGVYVLYSFEERMEIEVREICPDPSQVDLEFLIERRRLSPELRKVNSNLSFLAHVEKWKPDQLVKYQMDFGLIPEIRAKANLDFIFDPLWNTYNFTYTMGEKLIREKFGERPSPEDFRTLLTHPILPSDLRS